jgi:hypothetical protein
MRSFFQRGPLTQLVADEEQWDYVIDYIRIWDHKPAATAPATQKGQPQHR